jgi:hypothetical protein
MLNSHFILYFLVIIIVIYLIISLIIRLKMQFWRTQPVFHLYNLKYWLKPPGFINKQPPPVNKYVNLVNNKLINLSSEGENDGEKVKIKKICQFIQDYYVLHPTASYKPSQEDILAYLQSTNEPSFFNVYQEPTYLLENGVPSGSLDEEIIGVASIRVLNVTLHPKREKDKKRKKQIAFPAYYVDNLCVKPAYRKKGIPPQIIQTFYYNLSRTNPKVNAYMFKREGKLTAIVPLVYYESHSFDITHFQTDVLLNPSMTLLDIKEQQLNVLINFIKDQKTNFDCTILPDVSSFLHLVKLEKLLVYGILLGNELIAAYIFRPLELYYEGKKTMECIAIISNCKTSEVLVAGFNMSLLRSKTKSGADILLLEGTGHSEPVIKALLKNNTVFKKFTSPTAFYLYNYACYSFKKERTLLIY